MTPAVLPADFAWSQSAINDYLDCPRKFRLKHVERRRLDHVASGFAGPKGSGAHAGLALVLVAANDGRRPDDEEIHGAVLGGFAEALKRAQQSGESFDDDQAQAAIEALEHELVPLIAKIADDPRVRAVRWHRVEDRFGWVDERSGRRYQGTIDAAGVALQDVRAFGFSGREQVDLAEGDEIVCDWKTGDIDVDHVSRALNVQLAFYSVGIERSGGELPHRAFVARLGDVEPPVRPRDDQGETIPSKLRAANPAYADAAGVAVGSTAYEICKKRPKDAEGKPVSKWIERPNPAYVDATSRPRGPVFHACDLNFEIALQTIRDVITAAESGIYPAAGAATGQCIRCPFRNTCTSTTGETR